MSISLNVNQKASSDIAHVGEQMSKSRNKKTDIAHDTAINMLTFFKASTSVIFCKNKPAQRFL